MRRKSDQGLACACTEKGNAGGLRRGTLSCTDQRGHSIPVGMGKQRAVGEGYKEEDFMEAGNLMSIQYVLLLIQAFTQPIKQISAGAFFDVFDRRG